MKLEIVSATCLRLEALTGPGRLVSERYVLASKARAQLR